MPELRSGLTRRPLAREGRYLLLWVVATVALGCRSAKPSADLEVAQDAGSVRPAPSVEPIPGPEGGAPQPEPTERSGEFEVRGEAEADASAAAVEEALAMRYPILFTSNRAAFPFPLDVYMMSADGTEVRRVTNGGQFYSASWAPDGRAIAMSHALYETPNAFDVWLFAPDGTQPVNLTNSDNPELSDSAPTWSPDGESIVYSSERAPGEWRVWVASRSGGQHRALFPDIDAMHFQPSWSPLDANRIAYVGETEGVQDIWVANINVPVERRNLTGGRVDGPGILRWSPDGSRLAFHGRPAVVADSGAPTGLDVFVIDVVTGELSQVTDSPASEGQPTWSPDGASLLIASDADGDSELVRLALDGTVLEALTADDAQIFDGFPDWFRFLPPAAD